MTYHVHTGFRGGWVVRKSGSNRASKYFADRNAAVAWARRRCTELVTHRRDGTVLRIQPKVAAP